MSESAGKTFRGLQEAYASMYSNNSDNLTEETIVSEVQEEQEFEINEELLYESLKKYLISEGFVKTEKQAENAIPHMSEEWVKDIVESILTISEDFDYYINSLIEEGYDLSSYTEEDLFETYINETHNVLSEQLAGDMPGLGWLRGLTGIFGAGAASRAVQTKPRPYRTRPEGSAVDYGQMTLEKPKPKPTSVVKSKADDPWAADKPSSQAARDAQLAAAAAAGKTSAQSTPAPGGGPPEDPEKENATERALRRRADKKAEEQAKKQQRREQQANQPQTANQRIADKFKEYAADKALGALDAVKAGAKLPLKLGLGAISGAGAVKLADVTSRPALDWVTNQNYSRARKWIGKQFNQATGQTNAQSEFEKANK